MSSSAGTSSQMRRKVIRNERSCRLTPGAIFLRFQRFSWEDEFCDNKCGHIRIRKRNFSSLRWEKETKILADDFFKVVVLMRIGSTKPCTCIILVLP